MENSDVNKLIIATLAPLGIPVEATPYTGSELTYLTINRADDIGVVYADDEPQIDQVSMQIHLFTPLNYLTLKKQIRSKLFKAGFTYPQVQERYEEDTKTNHVVFECQIETSTESEE
jgi:hypothetical protein